MPYAVHVPWQHSILVPFPSDSRNYFSVSYAPFGAYALPPGTKVNKNLIVRLSFIQSVLECLVLKYQRENTKKKNIVT
jgi:hypothetical protein